MPWITDNIVTEIIGTFFIVTYLFNPGFTV